RRAPAIPGWEGVRAGSGQHSDGAPGDLRPRESAEQVVAGHLLVGEPRPVVAVALLAPEHLPRDLAATRLLAAQQAPGVVGLGPDRNDFLGNADGVQPTFDRLGVHALSSNVMSAR